MGMTLYWTVPEGGEKAFKTQLKNAGDTVKMRNYFKKYLLKKLKEHRLENGITEDDLNRNTLLVSKKNPFYTAKTNGVLEKLDGKQLFLGCFKEDNGEPKLWCWKQVKLDLNSQTCEFKSNGKDPNRSFFNEAPTPVNGWNEVKP